MEKTFYNGCFRKKKQQLKQGTDSLIKCCIILLTILSTGNQPFSTALMTTDKTTLSKMDIIQSFFLVNLKIIFEIELITSNKIKTNKII
ncbi:hypothetical protein [Bacillus sp. S3]|uniref:hypothetical protein n=1 Tax=Bacillus sp. S3 TaxID=486398 RepID=UPI0016809951|nr:hypothetical protein [Bacillus sp. S3]